MDTSHWRRTASLYVSPTTTIERLRDPDGTTVVRKRLDKLRATSTEARRFWHELRVNQGVASARIVPLTGFSETEQHLDLIFADTDAISLAQYLRDASPDLPTRLHLAREVATAVAELHAQGFAHRDVNPFNLVVAPRATTLHVQLIDLSLALPLAAAPAQQGPVGTLPYVAPEHTGRQHLRVDPRSDLYSLGVTLYELFTGQLPFEADDMAGWLHAHLANTPQDPRALQPALPAALAELLIQLLAKTPQARPQSARQLADQLGQLALPTAGSMPTAGATPPSGIVSSPHVRLVPSLRLVERATQLAAFTRLWTEMARGEHVLVTVSGSEGVGKSALIAEVRRQWRSEGVLWARMTAPVDAAQIAANLFDLARQLVRQALTRPESELSGFRERLLSRHAGALHLLRQWVPELDVAVAPTSASAVRSAATLRPSARLLTTTILRELFASFAPWRVVLEFAAVDAWTEAAARQAFDALPLGRINVVLTSSVNDPARWLLGRGHWQRHAAVQVPQLTNDGIAALLAELLTPVLPEQLNQLAHVLRERCGGRPRFLLDAVQHLQRNQLIVWHQGKYFIDTERLAQFALPEHVEHLGAVRIDELSDSSAHVLAVAACLGDPVELPVLGAALGENRGALLNLLAPLLAAGLLQRHSADDDPDATTGALFFSHAAVARAAARRLTADARRRIHGRIAAALQQSLVTTGYGAGAARPLHRQGPRLLRAAHHLNASLDLAVDTLDLASQRRAARINLQAGNVAHRAGMQRLAHRHFRLGLVLADTHSTRLRRALTRGATQTATLLGDVEQAERCARELLALVHGDGPIDRDDRLLALIPQSRAMSDDTFAASCAAFLDNSSDARPRPGMAAARNLSRWVNVVGEAPHAANSPGTERRWLARLAAFLLPRNPGLAVRAAWQIIATAQRDAQDLGHGDSVADADTSCAMAIIANDWCARGHRNPAEVLYAQALAAPPQTTPGAARAVMLWQGLVAPWFNDQDATASQLELAVRGNATAGDMPSALLAAGCAAANLFWGRRSLHEAAARMANIARELSGFSALPGAELLADYQHAVAALRSGVAPPRSPTLASNALVAQHRRTTMLYQALLDDDRAALRASLDQAVATGPSPVEAGRGSPFAIAAIEQTLLQLALCRSPNAAGSPGVAALRKAIPGDAGMRLLVQAERARARGELTNARKLFDATLECGLPLALENIARSTRATLPGRKRTARIDDAIAHWQSWGATQPVQRLRALRPDDSVGVPAAADAVGGAVDGGLSDVLAALHGLAGDVDPHALGERACREALRLCGAHHVWLATNAVDELTVIGHAQHDSAAAGAIPPWELLRFTSRTGETLRPGTMPELGTAAAHSLALPLRVAERTIGVLLAQDAQGSVTSVQAAEPALQLFATHLQVALHNARLYGDLSEARDEFRTLFESSDEGLLQVASDGRLLRANVALARLLGHSSTAQLLAERVEFANLFADQPTSHLAKHSASPSTSPSARELADMLVDGTLLTDTDVQLETPALRRDGSIVWIALRVRATRPTEHTATLRFECSMADISERMQREDAERQRQRAEATTQARSDFLAHMSHEIRTPLYAIVSASTMALRTQDNARLIAHVQVMKQAGTQLQALVNDVLDFAKIDAGHIELADTPISLAQLIDECRQLFAPLAAERGVVMLVNAADLDSSQLRGDPVRIRQILHNLLSNAVKFTDAGTIILGARTLAEPEIAGAEINGDDPDSATSTVEITVRDTGVGIAPDVLSRLFEPFTQAHDGSARQYGGTGLGLTIVQRLAQQMLGRVEVRSVPGAGSEFCCVLKLRQHNSARSGALRGLDMEANERLLTGLRVLLVDDNSINRDLAAELLTASGATVFTAGSADAALGVAQRERCDAVLMDMHMPGTDGIAAAQLLRRLPGWHTVPILALSADASDRARARAAAADFSGYLVKPIDPVALQQALSEVAAVRTDTGRTDEGRALYAAELPDSANDIDSSTTTAPVLDLPTALRNHGGNVQLLHRLLREFMRHYGTAPATLQQLLQSDASSSAAENLVHNLKSLGAAFGCQQLSCASAELEQVLGAREPVAEVLLDEFTQAHALFMNALRDYLSAGDAAHLDGGFVPRAAPLPADSRASP